MDELAIWIVDGGEATKAADCAAYPAAESFGCDWIAVEATSEEHAIQRAAAVDAHDELERILSTWSGLTVDRLAWHLAELGDEADECDGVYAVRFGCPRLDGCSRNHATGTREAGLSVYLADERDDGAWVLRDGRGDAVGTLVSLLAQGKIPYLVHGRIVGSGSDGEAVLADVTLCGRLVGRDGALVVVDE